MHKAFFDIHSDLPREAPGSAASTRRALSLIEDLPDSPAILDVGCGPGAQTIVLAEATNGTVTALDLHEPYLEEVERRADDARLLDRVRTVCADMASMDLEQTFDLIWAEGSIYNIGFEQGLRAWRPLVRRGGYLAVSELCWLDRAGAPESIREHWEAGYPAMTTVDENLASIAEAGYEPVGHFVLPDSDWRAEYYAPVKRRVEQLRPKYADQPDALAILDAELHEVELFEQNDGHYGYVFYVMRRP